VRSGDARCDEGKSYSKIHLRDSGNVRKSCVWNILPFPRCYERSCERGTLESPQSFAESFHKILRVVARVVQSTWLEDTNLPELVHLAIVLLKTIALCLESYHKFVNREILLLTGKHRKSTDDDQLFFYLYIYFYSLSSFLFFRALRSLCFHMLVFFAYREACHDFSRVFVIALSLDQWFRFKKKDNGRLSMSRHHEIEIVCERGLYRDIIHDTFLWNNRISEFFRISVRASKSRYIIDIVFRSLPCWAHIWLYYYSSRNERALHIIYFMILYFKTINLDMYFLQANAFKIMVFLFQRLLTYVINIVYCVWNMNNIYYTMLAIETMSFVYSIDNKDHKF